MIIPPSAKPKRRKHEQPEAKIQSESFCWLWNAHPEFRGLCFCCSNENERSGELNHKQQLISGAMRRSKGVVAGVSDLLFLLPRGKYHGLALECKSMIGIQSDKQIEWQEKIEAQGYCYKLFRSVENFKEIINWYLSL